MKAMLIAVILLSPDLTGPALQTAQTPAKDTRATVDPELREMALRAIVQQADTPRLIAMYDSEKTHELREVILRHIAQRDDQQARQKLVSIAKQDADSDLRETAVRYLAQRSDTAAVVELYDGQKDPEVKEVILRELGKRSDPAARQKLVAIVKTETDEDLQTPPFEPWPSARRLRS